MYNNVLKRFLFLMFCMLSSTYLQATNYYISSSEGNDNHSGKTEELPFKTLQKINTLRFKSGDTLFFKSGDLFRGSLEINEPGKPGRNIVLTSYGKGNKPVFSGAEKMTGWNKNSNYDEVNWEKPVYALFVDDKFTSSARYPKNEWLYFDGGGRDFMIDSGIEEIGADLLNATIRMRTKNWCYEYKQVESVNADSVFFDDELFFNNDIQYTCDPGWGYFFDNKKEFIGKPNDWAYDKKNKTLYYKANNKSSVIEAAVHESGLIIGKDAAYVEINNISFDKYHDSGIHIKKGASHIAVSNCKFSNIVLRGIDCREGSRHLTISGCQFSDIPGQGISMLEVTNSVIEKNKIKRIGLLPGFGINGVNGGMGIIITNNEVRPEGYKGMASNNVIRENIIDSIGNYGIRMDGKNSICEYNIVSNALLTFNDGALIYCWGLDSTFTYSNTIRNNIVKYSHGNLDGSPKDQLINVGIYIDNNTNHINVENNTVIGTQIGILFNSLSYNNTARLNTLFNNASGIGFSEFHKGRPIYGTSVKDNILIGIDYEQYSVFPKSYVHSTLNPGFIDGNFHYNPMVYFIAKYLTTHDEFRRQDEMSFEMWQKKGFDAHGHTVSRELLDEGYSLPELFVNESNRVKKIPLTGNYKYLNGESIKQLSIEPFSSIVLLKNTN